MLPDSDALYKVRWGMLLHERFNDTDAADLFREALAKDPTNAEAYVGLAIRLRGWIRRQGRGVFDKGHRARSEAGRST